MVIKVNNSHFLKYSIIILTLLNLTVSVRSQNIDIELLRSINSPEALPSDDFFRFISGSEPYIVAAVPVGMVVAGMLNKDKFLVRHGYADAAAVIVSGGLTYLLKYAVDRDRPYYTYPDIIKKDDVKTSSFPSGHTATAFATATSVSLAYPKWYVIAPSFTWAGVVGYSRMHLGVHYPSDVLAGALIGSGCAWISYEVNKHLLKQKSHSRRIPGHR